MSYSGSIWRDPGQDLSCFRTCSSCFRCQDKGSKPMCNRCSGRSDPELKRDPHDIDDQCRCKEGILQFRLRNGRLIKTDLPGDPFGGEVKNASKMSAHEREWQQWLNEQRERRNDPSFDPIEVIENE